MFTDPFGLCPDPKNPACPRTGGVLAVSVGGSAGFGVLGANFSGGIAINRHGDAMAFFKAGPSVAVGVMAGASITAQSGSLNDVVAPTGNGGGLAALVAPGIQRFSGGVLVGDDGKFAGATVGTKGGVGFSLDLSNGGIASRTVNLFDEAKKAAALAKQLVSEFFLGQMEMVSQ